ncbi:MAG: GTP 3',8-cyclase MoaA [Acidobacteria bacterium]|nr:GTP 3',8-cyclase MoaA [Acidobacteriota bacterium]
MKKVLRDVHQRPLEDLRISVTDRCNFRCTYCMPLDEYEWLHKSKILSFEEIERLARLFVELGVRRIRLTGGEPLVRQGLTELVARLAAIPGVEDLAMTTNASRLAKLAMPLREAGLRRVTVSVDSVRPETFRRMTQRGDLAPALEGLREAKRVGLTPIKLNAVIEKGVNDGEILELAEFARSEGYELRFIEYMDVGNANRWRSEKLVSKAEILRTVAARYPLRPAGEPRGSRPAADYEYVDGGGKVGVIASVTEPFCGDCTRARLTADGRLVTCLFASTGEDLKTPLREGAADDALRERIAAVWRGRSDRYSEARLVALGSAGGYRPEDHAKIEMISLGG